MNVVETNSDRELVLLEQIEHDPDVTQASLAALLGVAVGTVNWHLKRLVAKGYVKVRRAQRRKLRYIITPEGLALRAHLTVNYIETSMRLYRRTRHQVLELLSQVIQTGYKEIIIDGEGDIADICRLTCLEQGVQIIDHHHKNCNEIDSSSVDRRSCSSALTPDGIPVLEVRGTRVTLRMD
jgi:DNA-binding MarR family transcriptional regulator